MKKRLFVFLISLLSLCSCGNNQNDSSRSDLSSQEEQITNKYLLDKKAKQFKAAADRCEYDFDPTSVKMEKRKNADGSELTPNDIRELAKSIKSPNDIRTNNGKEIHLCYRFEGFFAEGFSGDYSVTKNEVALWEDGIAFLKSGSYLYPGIWWKESETVHVDFAQNNKVLTFASVEEDGNCFLPTPFLDNRYATRKVHCLGGYYYPTVGIFIEDIELRNEIVADEVYKKQPIESEAPVYKVDKSLNYFRISTWDDELKFTHIPEWNYPHDDNYVADYKGMTATYNVKILPSAKKFNFSTEELDQLEFPLYSFQYLKHIYARTTDDPAFGYNLDGSKLHTYLNAETSELSAYLPDGTVNKTHIRFSTREEDNHLYNAYEGNDFDFVFKSQKSLEISFEGKIETISIKLSHQFGYYHPIATINEPQHDHQDCLINRLNTFTYLKDSRNQSVVTLCR